MSTVPYTDPSLDPIASRLNEMGMPTDKESRRQAALMIAGKKVLATYHFKPDKVVVADINPKRLARSAMKYLLGL